MEAYQGYPFPLHPRMRPFVDVAEGLASLAAEAAREFAARKKKRERARRPKRGTALLAGPDTPLWNELVKQVAPMLRKHGSKVRLARFLGISRQRLHICLKSRSGCLDAERTLLLLLWLSAQRAGRSLS